MTSSTPRRNLRDDDEDGWRTWYYESIGYRYTPPPKVTLAMNATPYLPTPKIVSCFAAGTPVLTITGPRPIETLRVGERVLSQDVTTGGSPISRSLSSTTTPRTRRCGSRWTTATPSWPASSTASGSRAVAGRWPAT